MPKQFEADMAIYHLSSAAADILRLSMTLEGANMIAKELTAMKVATDSMEAAMENVTMLLKAARGEHRA